MAFLGAIGLWEDPVLPLMALSNALLLATFLKVGGTRPHWTPWLARILAAAGALNLCWSRLSCGTRDGGW